jgi:hypothetical protein
MPSKKRKEFDDGVEEGKGNCWWYWKGIKIY